MKKAAKSKEEVFSVERSLSMNPNEMKGSTSAICSVCGMEQPAWARRGQGYRNEGELYCCRGCAEETGCTCQQRTAANQPNPTPSSKRRKVA